jgi:hypothetical protein
LDALQIIGPKDVKAIASFVGSRSATQVRTHAQKFFLKLVSSPLSIMFFLAHHGACFQAEAQHSSLFLPHGFS